MRPLARLLRPLVRLLITSGVTFPVLADLLRGLYVEVARTELLTDPRARTDSRVSLLTGVHRKELRRHRTELPATGDAPPEIVTRSSAILAMWLGSPGTSAPAADGQMPTPLPLPRSGPAPSFEALVSSVTRDVRPRAVLDEFLEQGIVTLGADEMVRLNVAAFIPPGESMAGRAAQLFYFARNLHDHLAAASANVLAGGAPAFVDRSLHYDRLSPAAAAQLEAAGRAAAQTMLLELNRTAIAIADADSPPAVEEGASPGLRRVNVGVYVYLDDDTESGAGEAASDTNAGG